MVGGRPHDELLMASFSKQTDRLRIGDTCLVQPASSVHPDESAGRKVGEPTFAPSHLDHVLREDELMVSYSEV